MIIAFDIGNSFIKWKVITEGGSFLERGSCQPSHISKELHRFRDQSFKLALFTNVSDEDLIQNLKELIKADLWRQLTSQKNLLGVTNAYACPEMLGVDRWITAVEAYNKADHQAVMIVDAGTAITLDVVNEGGLHQGGFIVPSEYLMQEILLQRTAKIKLDDGVTSKGYGNNTNCAVRVGIQRMLDAWISYEIQEFKKQFPHGKIYFTGGARIESDLGLNINDDIVFDQDLLLDGLIRAGRELE